MAWQRARNMDRLRTDALAVWPGMTIFDIGDTAHASGRSGHNPDDTVLPEGGTAELSDPDVKQEVRALDFMLGPEFTAADARELVAALRDPRSRRRLYYVIYDRRIYRRDGSDSAYTGSNPHTDHVHASGWWEDDENTTPWAAVLEKGQDMTPDENLKLRWIDARLEAIGNGLDDIAADRPGAGQDVWLVRAVKSLGATLGELAEDVAELKARPAPGTVEITDEQLERVLRRVLGSVDEIPPA